MKTNKRQSRHKVAIAHLLLVLAASMFPLLITEAGMRLYHAYVKIHSPYERAVNPRLIFVRKPHAYDEINAYGFRDHEYVIQKSSDVFRIIVLGDSVTNGFRVSFVNMYTQKLQALLNSHHRKYEVINFGMDQYSTVQEVALLKEIGVTMDPDLVILAYVLNDPTPDGSINGFFKRDRSVSLTLEWITRKSKLMLKLRDPFYRLRNCSYFDYYSHMHCDAVKWKAVQQAFQELRTLSRQYGFRVLLTVFPLLENGVQASFNHYRWSAIHERIIEEATRNGFSSLDLLPHFAKRAPKELKISTNDKLHPNKLGNEFAATAIYQKLVKIGIVK